MKSLKALGTLLFSLQSILLGAQSIPDGLYAMVFAEDYQLFIELHYDKAPMTVANFVGLADLDTAPLVLAAPREKGSWRAIRFTGTATPSSTCSQSCATAKQPPTLQRRSSTVLRAPCLSATFMAGMTITDCRPA